MSETTPERRRNGDVEVANLRAEVHTLSELTREVNQQLPLLREALDSVADLRDNQRIIEETARAASTRVEVVEGNSNRRARRLTKFVVAMIIVGILFVAGAIIAAAAYVHSQHQFQKSLAAEQAKTRQASYDSCTTRNASLVAGKAFTLKLIEAERHAVDQATAQALITDLTATQAQQNPVDCTQFLKH